MDAILSQRSNDAQNTTKLVIGTTAGGYISTAGERLECTIPNAPSSIVYTGSVNKCVNVPADNKKYALDSYGTTIRLTPSGKLYIYYPNYGWGSEIELVWAE